MSFRLSSKSFFLTYPRCPIPKEIAYTLLQDKVDIEKYIIAEEKHEDGSAHIHAYIVAKRKYNFKNPRCFDLEWNNTIYHGDYQTVKDHNRTKTYCRKEGNFIENLEAAAENDDIWDAHDNLDDKQFLSWCIDHKISPGFYNEVKRIAGASMATLNSDKEIDNWKGKSIHLIR